MWTVTLGLTGTSFAGVWPSCEPGDEQEGAWPRERLEAMGARFVELLERAIERGEERPPMHRSAEAAE